MPEEAKTQAQTQEAGTQEQVPAQDPSATITLEGSDELEHAGEFQATETPEGTGGTTETSTDEQTPDEKLLVDAEVYKKIQADPNLKHYYGLMLKGVNKKVQSLSEAEKALKEKADAYDQLKTQTVPQTPQGAQQAQTQEDKAAMDELTFEHPELVPYRKDLEKLIELKNKKLLDTVDQRFQTQEQQAQQQYIQTVDRMFTERHNDYPLVKDAMIKVANELKLPGTAYTVENLERLYTLAKRTDYETEAAQRIQERQKNARLSQTETAGTQQDKTQSAEGMSLDQAFNASLTQHRVT
jgi:hypothetical protein